MNGTGSQRQGVAVRQVLEEAEAKVGHDEQKPDIRLGCRVRELWIPRSYTHRDATW